MKFSNTLVIYFIYLITMRSIAMENLEKFKWQKRVLLLNESSKSSEQENLFRKNSSSNIERDLILLKNSSSNDNFEMKLIGKDGGVKEVYDTPTSMNKIYKLIDSMPMRKLEMNKEKK